jgi:hypothetical protein
MIIEAEGDLTVSGEAGDRAEAVDRAGVTRRTWC